MHESEQDGNMFCFLRFGNDIRFGHDPFSDITGSEQDKNAFRFFRFGVTNGPTCQNMALESLC